MREIAVDFIYSLNTKRRVNSHAKCTVWVSTKLTSLQLAARTSTVATVSKKVKMVTSTHNLPLSSLHKKLFIFCCGEKTNSTAISCIGKIYHMFAPWETTWHHFYPISPKRVQRWRASWIRFIHVQFYQYSLLCPFFSFYMYCQISYLLCLAIAAPVRLLWASKWLTWPFCALEHSDQFRFLENCPPTPRLS